MSDFKSWDELTVLEQLQSTWWDAYKDAFNFRPRGIDTTGWTEQDFINEIEKLGSIIAEQERQRQLDKAAAVVKFEQLVLEMMAIGAKTHEDALRWIMDASNCNGDWEFLAYQHGLPFGFFQKSV